METLVRTRHYLDGTHYVHIAEKRDPLLYGFTFAGHLVVGDGHSVYRSGCDSFALLRVQTGKCRLVVDGKSLTVREGQLAFYDQMLPNVFTTADDGPLVVDAVYVYGPNLRQLYRRCYEAHGNILEGFDGERFSSAVYDLYNARGTAYENSAAVYTLLMQIMRSCGSEKETDIDAAISFIRRHYAEDIGLEEMAAAAFLSKYYFLRKFKRVTGMTPKEFLEEVRFEQSKVFLRDGRMSIADVAESVGCGDVRTLVAIFRERTGVTPAVFRKYAVEAPADGAERA